MSELEEMIKEQSIIKRMFTRMDMKTAKSIWDDIVRLDVSIKQDGYKFGDVIKYKTMNKLRFNPNIDIDEVLNYNNIVKRVRTRVRK